MKLSDPKIAIPVVIVAIIAVVFCVVSQKKKAINGIQSPEEAMKMDIPDSAPAPAPIPVPAGPQAPQ